MSQSGYRKGSRAQFDEYLPGLSGIFRLTWRFFLPSAPAGAPAAAVSTGDFSVQVGFFTKEMNAVNFKNKLAARGYSVFVDGSKEGYRVKVGRFKTQSEALSMEKKLPKKVFRPRSALVYA
jgi:predicted RNA-binding protein with TRAM domain